VDITYEEEELQQVENEQKVMLLAVGDRSSNLKFMLAIQNSEIWTDIKKRSLTIKTQRKLNDAIDGKSLNELSDQELADLKRVYHDGLKCVAVDQIMVLKEVKQQLEGGKVSLHTVISKITHVITDKMTEYHEDIYQYDQIRSGNQSNVYESMTAIVEENKELCQIDSSVTNKSRPKTIHNKAIGAHDQHGVKKNIVKDQHHNNSDVQVKYSDKNNRNQRTVKNNNSNDETNNKGSVNYGRSNNSTNNGTNEDGFDIKQLVDSMDKVYSSLLNDITKK